jgi:uncharacterized protein DUF4351
VAAFTSEGWPPSPRNRWPPSRRNPWPPSLGIRKASSREELPIEARELARLIPPVEGSELRHSLGIWLRHLLRRQLPGVTIPEVVDLEDTAMLEETLSEWSKGVREEGLQVGRKTGQVEGMQRLLLRLLGQRFGTLPSGVKKRVRAITSLSRLEELALRVLSTGSLAEIGLG